MGSETPSHNTDFKNGPASSPSFEFHNNFFLWKCLLSHRQQCNSKDQLGNYFRCTLYDHELRQDLRRQRYTTRIVTIEHHCTLLALVCIIYMYIIYIYIFVIRFYITIDRNSSWDENISTIYRYRVSTDR